MKKTTLFILTAVTAVLFAACGGTTENRAANAAAGNAAKPAPGPPTKEALVALERQALEAWKNKDGKFFKGMLVEDFVLMGPNVRVGKTDAIKVIEENKCTVNSAALSDEIMTPVGKDAAVLTAKVTSDIECEGKKMPSPVITASVYVRASNGWKVAYHSEVPVSDGKAAPAKLSEAVVKTPTEAELEAEGKEKSSSGGGLMDIEKAGWDAWMARDAKKLEEMTGPNMLYVDPTGKVFASKADTIKAWTEPKCDIKSVDVSDGTTVQLAPDASMLIFTGTATGTCEGQKLMPLTATSLYEKQGDAWKLVYNIHWAK